MRKITEIGIAAALVIGFILLANFWVTAGGLAVR